MSKKFIPKPIKEQVILITGASSGIGLATAKMAAQEGASVILSSRNLEELENCVKEIRSQGGKAIPVKADVSSFEDLKYLRREAIKTFGRIDTWINNAGTSLYGYLQDTKFEDEKKLFEINFWGTRMACALAVDELSRKGGIIINLGSEVSVAAQPLLGMYSASKHALKAFTDSLRSELRDRNIPIEVCLIRPTAIDTPFPDHATNLLPNGEPSLPGPVYHPEVAARAILKCAVNPQRDVFVGGPAKLSAVIETFFPQVKDLMAETRMKELKEGTQIPHKEEQEGLWHPTKNEGKVSGKMDRNLKTKSIYTEITTFSFVRDLVSALKMRKRINQ